METVTLKNGAEEALPLVTVTMLSIRSLMQKDPIAFYELVMKCRDRQHQFYGNTGEVLQSLSLLDNRGCVQGSIRNIVLSAVEGDGLEMSIRSPVAPKNKAD